MPVKYHPSEPYVRRVPAWKMHVYTMVQVFALAVLWTVKSSSFSLAFPFFLIMMVPLRQQLTHFFNPREINAVIFLPPNIAQCQCYDFINICFSPFVACSWTAKIHLLIQMTSLISTNKQEFQLRINTIDIGNKSIVFFNCATKEWTGLKFFSREMVPNAPINWANKMHMKLTFNLHLSKKYQASTNWNNSLVNSNFPLQFDRHRSQQWGCIVFDGN